ncbi:jacalin-like lectin [Sorangium sp. So ce291]|uniref:jacalin-like lectin n=1 Tax=Sorangium sp. So ce291 TaxID=3133294 RepID=UPI003F633BBB
MCQALGISWSLGASIPGVGGASRKSKFVKTLKITTYSLTIVVYSKHVDKTETAADAHLLPTVEPPRGDAALRDFFYAYGDSFITSLTTGSEYYGMYVLYAQTKEEQRGIENELKAKGIYNGVELSAALQTSLNNSMKSINVNITFDQQVSGIQNPILPSPDKMIDYAIAFPSIPVSAPVVIGFEYDGYEHLPEITTSFIPIANNRIYFIGDKAIGGLTAKEAEVKALDDQLLWLQQTYSFYSGYSDSKVNQVKGMSGQELAAIQSQKSAYARDPVQSFTAPQLPSLGMGTPALSFTAGTSASKGSGGGSPYDDVPSPADYISKRTRITRIKMKMGDRVDKLTTTYLDQNGTVEMAHGGSGGREERAVTVAAGQFVRQVSGKYNKKMDRMTFLITDGSSVTAGGNGGDKTFELAPPSGNFVLGFRGRSGSEYDEIQLVYAQFNPAVWSA